jgi:hypothetical protein
MHTSVASSERELGGDCFFVVLPAVLSQGLAVGVGFGALGDLPSAIPASASNASVADQSSIAADVELYKSMFADARNLAVGVGLQNFPEGLAVSLPLMRLGYSRTRSFWYGQLSGIVEPVGGLLGASLIQFVQPLLPYALAFAAGAMIFVVAEDILPEIRSKGGYPTLGSWGLMVG